MTYGAEIKRGREAMRMTQEQLAEAIGVSRQAVSKWEMDLSRPAREKLTRLSEVLEIPAETWEAIDAEQAAAERPKNTAGPWQAATAALTVLCLLLAASLVWALSTRAPKAPPETEPAVPLPADREEDPFPEAPPAVREEEADPAPQDQTGFRLGAYNGRVSVLSPATREPEMIFDIFVRTLPDPDQQLLREGIQVETYEELTRLIEDYIS